MRRETVTRFKKKSCEQNPVLGTSITVMRVYSPSQTEAWFTCPLLRTLEYKEGYGPKRITKRDFGRLVGAGFARGVAQYNIYTRDFMDQAERAPINIDVDFLPGITSAIATETKGRFIDEEDRIHVDGLPARAATLLRKYAIADPIPNVGWRVTGVEVKLPDQGNCILDLTATDHLGCPTFVDYKTKLTLKPEYYQRELERFSHSWQMYHYAWAWEQATGQKIKRYYICLVVEAPFKVRLLPFEIDDEFMKLWETSAKVAWRRMEEEDTGLVAPGMAPRHETIFGPCVFQAACLQYKLDPVMMDKLYHKRERGADAATV